MKERLLGMKLQKVKHLFMRNKILFIGVVFIALALKSPDAMPTSLYGGMPRNVVEQMYEDVLQKDEGLKKLHESIESFEQDAGKAASPTSQRVLEINRYFADAKSMLAGLKDSAIRTMVMARLSKSENALRTGCIKDAEQLSGQLYTEITRLNELENALKVWITIDQNEKKCKAGMNGDEVSAQLKNAQQLEKQLRERFK